MVRTNVHDANSTCMKFAEHQQTMNDLESVLDAVLHHMGDETQDRRYKSRKVKCASQNGTGNDIGSSSANEKDDSSAERAAQFAKYNIGNDFGAVAVGHVEKWRQCMLYNSPIMVLILDSNTGRRQDVGNSMAGIFVHPKDSPWDEDFVCGSFVSKICPPTSVRLRTYFFEESNSKEMLRIMTMVLGL